MAFMSDMMKMYALEWQRSLSLRDRDEQAADAEQEAADKALALALKRFPQDWRDVGALLWFVADEIGEDEGEGSDVMRALAMARAWVDTAAMDGAAA